MCARLRPGNSHASTGALADVERIVTQLRAAWPTVRITLRADAGFPVHTVEAMACAKPVIASPLVVDGLGLRPDGPLLMAGSAAEFADRAIALLQHPHLAESLGGRGRLLVLQRFDIRAVAERLEEILQPLLPPQRERQTSPRRQRLAGVR